MADAVPLRPAPLRAFLSHNRLGLLGILLGAVGLYGTYHFYQLSRESREPVFVVDPVRTEIISAQRILTAPIRVLKRNGVPITKDLFAIRFYFWNAGQRPILAQEVLDPLRIVLQDSAGEILDYKVVKVSRSVARVHLLPVDSSRVLQTLGLTFSILEHNDGVGGQLIYQGNRGAPLVMTGTIEGVARIGTSADVSAWSVIWHGMMRPFL